MQKSTATAYGFQKVTMEFGSLSTSHPFGNKGSRFLQLKESRKKVKCLLALQSKVVIGLKSANILILLLHSYCYF